MATRTPSPELQQAIVESARELGVRPADLATAIGYETIGTFDSWKKGPTTQWGEHRGLIQWGEPQRRQYGVYEGMSDADQMKAATRYLKNAGLKPGMGLLDIYSAINAGHVGRYKASDRPGKNVSTHVAEMSRTYLPDMEKLFGSGGDGLASMPRQPTLQRGDYTPAVAAWQRQLNALGYNTNGAEGKFGPATQKATKAFQEANWLTNDARVGPQTRFAANIGQGIGEGSIAQPAGGTQVADMSPSAMGFGPRVPTSALFPSGGPTPPMPIGGPGTFPAGPMPVAPDTGSLPGIARNVGGLGTSDLPMKVPGREQVLFERPPMMAPAMGLKVPAAWLTPPEAPGGVRPVNVNNPPKDLPAEFYPPDSFYAGTNDRRFAISGPGRSPSGPAPIAMSPTLGTKDDIAQSYSPFDLPQPWGAAPDDRVSSLPARLPSPNLPSSAPFGFAQAGGAGNALAGADVTGGRNLALMGRAPVNMANAGAASVSTPNQLRDQKSAQGFGNFVSGIGQMFSPFMGGTQPALAAPPQLRSGASAAYGPMPAPAPVNRPSPPTITPQQFQQRFAPMGAASIPQDVTYRVASNGPVAPPTPRYDPLSSAYVARPAASVPGVTFATPAASVEPAGGPSPLSLAGGALGSSLMGAGAFGVGVPQEPVKQAVTPAKRVMRAAVPVAASLALGPIGGLLARGIMGLATGGPLAQRVGQAIAYPGAVANSIGYSPFTPPGFTAPNFNSRSGGSTYAYRSTAPGVGTFINSAGHTVPFDVGAGDRVYGAGGYSLSGFRP